jgi:hypothetical protein
MFLLIMINSGLGGLAALISVKFSVRYKVKFGITDIVVDLRILQGTKPDITRFFLLKYFRLPQRIILDIGEFAPADQLPVFTVS